MRPCLVRAQRAMACNAVLLPMPYSPRIEHTSPPSWKSDRLFETLDLKQAQFALESRELTQLCLLHWQLRPKSLDIFQKDRAVGDGRWWCRNQASSTLGSIFLRTHCRVLDRSTWSSTEAFIPTNLNRDETRCEELKKRRDQTYTPHVDRAREQQQPDSLEVHTDPAGCHLLGRGYCLRKAFASQERKEHPDLWTTTWVHELFAISLQDSMDVSVIY